MHFVKATVCNLFFEFFFFFFVVEHVPKLHLLWRGAVDAFHEARPTEQNWQQFRDICL